MAVDGKLSFLEKTQNLQEMQINSERTRLTLEQEMYAHYKSDARIERLRARQLQEQWKKVTEKERKSHARNAALLKEFDRVESHLKDLGNRTQKLEIIKKQYEDYIQRMYPSWKEQCEQAQQTHQEPTFTEQMFSIPKHSRKEYPVGLSHIPETKPEITNVGQILQGYQPLAGQLSRQPKRLQFEEEQYAHQYYGSRQTPHVLQQPPQTYQVSQQAHPVSQQAHQFTYDPHQPHPNSHQLHQNFQQPHPNSQQRHLVSQQTNPVSNHPRHASEKSQQIYQQQIPPQQHYNEIPLDVPCMTEQPSLYPMQHHVQQPQSIIASHQPHQQPSLPSHSSVESHSAAQSGSNFTIQRGNDYGRKQDGRQNQELLEPSASLQGAHTHSGVTLTVQSASESVPSSHSSTHSDQLAQSVENLDGSIERSHEIGQPRHSSTILHTSVHSSNESINGSVVSEPDMTNDACRPNSGASVVPSLEAGHHSRQMRPSDPNMLFSGNVSEGEVVQLPPTGLPQTGSTHWSFGPQGAFGAYGGPGAPTVHGSSVVSQVSGAVTDSALGSMVPVLNLNTRGSIISTAQDQGSILQRGILDEEQQTHHLDLPSGSHAPPSVARSIHNGNTVTQSKEQEDDGLSIQDENDTADSRVISAGPAEEFSDFEEEDIDQLLGNDEKTDQAETKENSTTVDQKSSHSSLTSVSRQGMINLILSLDDMMTSHSQYYRGQHQSDNARTRDIVRRTNEGKSLQEESELNLSMVVLSHLPHLVRSTCHNQCIISEKVLTSKKPIRSEIDIRSHIYTNDLELWDTLLEHFRKLLRKGVITSEKVAGKFGPLLIKEDSKHTLKAISVLTEILEKLQFDETIDVSDSSADSPEKSPENLQVVPPLDLPTSSNDPHISDTSEDSTEEVSSNPTIEPDSELAQSAAYRALLQGTMTNTAKTAISDDESSDDLEHQVAAVVSPKSKRSRGGGESQGSLGLSYGSEDFLERSKSEISNIGSPQSHHSESAHSLDGVSPPLSPANQDLEKSKSALSTNRSEKSATSKRKGAAFRTGSDIDTDSELEPRPLGTEQNKGEDSDKDFYDFYD